MCLYVAAILINSYATFRVSALFLAGAAFMLNTATSAFLVINTNYVCSVFLYYHLASTIHFAATLCYKLDGKRRRPRVHNTVDRSGGGDGLLRV
jgi:hypothetical protein